MAMKEETEFKRFVVGQYGRWSSAVEFGMGGDEGFPDLVLQIDRNVLVPTELKIAEIRNGLLVSKEIRPAQWGWHFRFNRAGGKSVFLFGVPIVRRKDFMVFAGQLRSLENWRTGLRMGVDVVSISSFETNSIGDALYRHLVGLVDGKEV